MSSTGRCRRRYPVLAPAASADSIDPDLTDHRVKSLVELATRMHEAREELALPQLRDLLVDPLSRGRERLRRLPLRRVTLSGVRS